MRKTREKFILINLSFLFIQSCVYLPEAIEEPNIDCKLYTKEFVLNYDNRFTKTLIDVNIDNCSGDTCKGILIAATAIPITTFIVSGSIVVVGNTIHWLEKEGKCDEIYLKQKITEFDRAQSGVEPN